MSYQFQSSPNGSLAVFVLAASDNLVLTLALGLGWRTAPRLSPAPSSSSNNDTGRFEVEIGAGEGLEGLEVVDLRVADRVGVGLEEVGEAVGLDVVNRIVGLGRGATPPMPDGLVRDGAGGGASAFRVVVHAVDTSDRSVDARLVDFVTASAPGIFATALGSLGLCTSTPLNPRADPAPEIDSGSSVCAVSNGPHASGSSSSPLGASSLKSSAPPSEDAEDKERRVVLTELMPVELDEEDEWGVCIKCPFEAAREAVVVNEGFALVNGEVDKTEGDACAGVDADDDGVGGVCAVDEEGIASSPRPPKMPRTRSTAPEPEVVRAWRSFPLATIFSHFFFNCNKSASCAAS